MPIVGIHFTKISAERNKPIIGTVNIKNNVVLTDVKKKELKGPASGCNIEFEFAALCEPGGSIKIEGEVDYLGSKKDVDDVLAVWKKDKQLSDKLAKPVMNYILVKSNIEALVLGREVGLPPTIHLPKIKDE